VVAERLRNTKMAPLRGCSVFVEHPPADGGQAIDPLAEIDRLYGHKDAALRSELHPQCASRKARTRVARGRVESPGRRRRRAPRRHSSLISVAGLAGGYCAGGGTSMKRKVGTGVWQVRSCWVTICFLRSLGESLKCLATRLEGIAVARAAA
jgi:hypothetical protein